MKWIFLLAKSFLPSFLSLFYFLFFFLGCVVAVVVVVGGQGAAVGDTIIANYWVAVVGCQGVAVGDISDKNYQSLSCCSWWPSSCCWRFIWQVAVAELLRRCSCSWWPRSCCWRHNNANYWVAVVGSQGVAVGDLSDKNYQSLSCCSWWPSSCCWRFIWQVAVAELLRRCGCSWWPRSCCWRHNTANYWVAVVGGQIVVGVVVVLFTFTIELYSHKNWIQAHLQLESWHFLESGGFSINSYYASSSMVLLGCSRQDFT